MVQYLEVPNTSSFTPNYNLRSYRSLNARSLINGFCTSSARENRDFANLSSYTRRSNSDYGLPQVYQNSPSISIPVTPLPSTFATTPPSYRRPFERLSTPMFVDTLENPIKPLENNEKSDAIKLSRPSHQGHSFYTRETSKENMTVLEIIHIFLAELLGTAILMFIGCSTQAGYMVWTFGIAAIIAIHIVGPISGAHINPGATIVALIMGKLQYIMVPVYWIAQFLGAFLGYWLQYAIIVPGERIEDSYCMTKPLENSTPRRTFGIEIVYSFVFFLAIAALWEAKNKHSSDTASLKIGFILYGMLLTVAPDAPLSMNTARSLAPAILMNDFEDHWIYWVAPNLGAFLAGGFHRIVFSNRPYLETEEDKNIA